MNKHTRRSFLTACSAAGLAAALPSFYVQASDKSGTRLPVLGTGPHTYECVHDWLVPPEGLVWGDTHGLCQDEQGHIYVVKQSLYTTSKDDSFELLARSSGAEHMV